VLIQNDLSGPSDPSFKVSMLEPPPWWLSCYSQFISIK